jgi:hypothetical protein
VLDFWSTDFKSGITAKKINLEEDSDIGRLNGDNPLWLEQVKQLGGLVTVLNPCKFKFLGPFGQQSVVP